MRCLSGDPYGALNGPHQEKEKEKKIHYNHSMQWIMLDMIRYVQVID